MLYFILFILFALQAYTLSRIISFHKIRDKSEEVIKRYEEVIKRYDGVITLEKIPNKISYSDVEPDWKTFYDFMENIKLEGWKAEIRIDRDSCWVVNLISHDQKSSMSVRLRDYGDGIFLSNCNIRAGGTSLVASREDKIAKDIILFVWDYVIEHYKNINQESIDSYKSSINRISAELKTLNRSQRLNNILEL